MRRNDHQPLALAYGVNRKRLWVLRIVSPFIVLVIIVLLLLVFELFARWHFSDVLSTSHGRDYFSRRSAELLIAENNNIRFRGADILIPTGKTYRVVVLGDSLAWGQGVYPYTSRFPELAEKLFEERYPGTDIEVVNLGVPGYNLRDHIHLLSFLLELKPDFVLYQWYVNDVEKHVDIGQFHTLTLLPDLKWHAFAMDHSVTYILLYRTWNQVRASLGLQKFYTEYLVAKMQDPAGKASVWAQQALHKLVATIRERGVAVGIVLFPQCRSNMNEYELAFLHERVLWECAKSDIPCLDLRQAFSAFAGRMEELRASSLDSHPSKTAHRIAAEQIVEAFGPIWLEAVEEGK